MYKIIQIPKRAKARTGHENPCEAQPYIIEKHVKHKILNYTRKKSTKQQCNPPNSKVSNDRPLALPNYVL